jgi:hypothetical protein
MPPFDFFSHLTNLAAQARLRSQSEMDEPQVAVLVLSGDRQTILEAALHPLSELTAILASQHSTHSGDNCP